MLVLLDESQARDVQIYNNVIYGTNIGNHVPGGGISTAGFSNTVIENNVIYNTKGNGINIIYDYDDPGFDNVDYYIRNNIIMAGTSNGYAVRNYEGSTHDVTVEYNNIYENSGTYTGSGITYRNNIAVDPLFYSEGSKDFHLKSSYGRWTGSSWTTDSVTSPCIDAGHPDSDYDYERENNGDQINIGAYGNTNEASLSGASTGGGTLNEAPTATIDSISPNPATVGEKVTFAGSGSDNDGTIASYLWEEDGEVLSTSSSFSTSDLSVGTHTISFSVEDNYGESSEIVTGKVTIEAANAAPTATITSINPETATVGEDVTFTGSGSDSDGTISSYLWEDNGAFLSDEAVFTTSGLSVGTHTISFSVVDNDGESSEVVSDTVTITEVPNVAPTATIDSIIPNPATVGEEVTFTGSGIDGDGTISSYLWSEDGAVLSTSSSFSTSVLSVGTHTIEFSVVDDDGETSEAVTDTVTITEIPNVAPTATIESTVQRQPQ
ncbi:MAG: right-handed parallel beta-helix repeat-containing protein [Methanolobus sp.]